MIAGKPLNLTCSSRGGSPPPQIKWYREGESQLLESTMILGANRDEESSSVLTINPSKRGDGATYRCTVWNRALGQRQKLETRASLTVNCKSPLSLIFVLIRSKKAFLHSRFSPSNNWTAQPTEDRGGRHGSPRLSGSYLLGAL